MKSIQYYDCINGYDVYIIGKSYCRELKLPYPLYAAFIEGDEPEPYQAECTMSDLDNLLEWCEDN